jgi:hypothetical protein
MLARLQLQQAEEQIHITQSQLQFGNELWAHLMGYYPYEVLGFENAVHDDKVGCNVDEI